MHLLPTPIRASALLPLTLAAALVLPACGGGDGGEPAQAPPATSSTATTPPEPATVDSKRVESALKRNFRGLSMPAVPATVYPSGGGAPEQSQFGGGRMKVRSVDCPDGIPARRGATFGCDVDVAKGSGTVRLTELDSNGTRFRFKASFESEVTPGVRATTRIRGKIKVAG